MSNSEFRQIESKLEDVFNRIQIERMSDMPMVNKKLKIHALGFQSWQKSTIGVLITPWFMNLILLPGEEEDWSEYQELGTNTHIFPSGRYQFITAREKDIGTYQTCSLFSPMFEFADDDAAVETGEVVIKELMNEENQDEQHIQPEQMEAIWNGNPEEAVEQNDATEIPSTEENRPTISERLEQPVSRRELLRGVLQLDGDKND